MASPLHEVRKAQNQRIDTSFRRIKMQNNLKLIKRQAVEVLTAMSRSTIYARMDSKSPHYDPEFPRPIQLSPYSVAWVEQEVIDYIANLINASRQEGISELRQIRIKAKQLVAVK
jgi:prophage regulatory protein